LQKLEVSKGAISLQYIQSKAALSVLTAVRGGLFSVLR
jgi:hypothetical protein